MKRSKVIDAILFILIFVSFVARAKGYFIASRVMTGILSLYFLSGIISNARKSKEYRKIILICLSIMIPAFLFLVYCVVFHTGSALWGYSGLFVFIGAMFGLIIFACIYHEIKHG